MIYKLYVTYKRKTPLTPIKQLNPSFLPTYPITCKTLKIIRRVNISVQKGAGKN